MKLFAAFLFSVLITATSLPPLAAQESANSAQSGAFAQSIENAKMEMMADPQEALSHSDKALELASAQTGSERGVNRATALWLKAESLIGLNQLDDAGAVATEALETVEAAKPGSKLHGDLLRSRGAVKALSGNVQDALADYQAAHDIFREAKITRSQAMVLQDIGQIYWEAGDYERTLRYYGQAVEIYNDDPGFALSNHNNLGETYKMLERFAEAEAEYALAIEAARELESPLLETRILSNLALVQIEQGKLTQAAQTTDRALALARNGEAAEWRNFVYGVQARIAFERKDYGAAARYLDQTFAGADFEQTDLVYREFHELGADVFQKIDQPAKAFAHLSAYQRLDSQARDLVASASSQLMAARFDFANQNLRISQLKQGQLERDIQIERERSEFRTTAFTGSVIALSVILILVLLAFFSIRRSRNEVREANTQLTVVNTDLEHALNAKTDFLAMTSHEIRTPLNGILGTAQVLIANRVIDEDSMKRVKLIQSAGQTMKALVDDLLDVAKMESGDISLELGPTQINPLLVDSADLWRDKLRAKGLELNLATGTLPGSIETDGGRLRQIVFNLISNAVKFTREGSITLRSDIRADSGEFLIEVIDTGIGIAEDQQTKVFEAFHQVDNATTREFNGTGLGLSICRNLADAMGGRMELESVLGKGSTFRVILPLKVIEADANEDTGAPAVLGDCRLGLVEANPMKQAILTGLIEPHVKSVAPFLAADDCESAIANRSIDHIVLDAGSIAESAEHLPALRDLLAAAHEAAIPATVLFSPKGELPLEEVSRLNHTQLLIKPIAGDALIAALEEHYSRAAEANKNTAAKPSADNPVAKENGYASAA